MPYNADDARREFRPRLRRYNVLLLGTRLGLTPSTTRSLLECGGIPPVRYPGATRAYYDLESAIKAMLPTN